jgi:D-alanyl-D-alanine carboxypeptidase/D-alanyl-D-alanine-endopeptidase (penicillin-binding protein 4)
MTLRLRLVLVLLPAFLVAPPTQCRAADELADRLNAVLDAPEYQHARWGLLIVEAETGKVVFARNPDQLFAPASVTKLYSCAAALRALGADRTFQTPVHRRGEVRDGRLNGDLILAPQGDLTLGGRTTPDGKLAFRDRDHTYANYLSSTAQLTDTDPLAGLRDLARQIKAAGINSVDGDVYVDDRYFTHGRATGSGPEIVSPVVVNDNCLDLIVTPGAKVGVPATVKVRPATEFYKVEIQVETVEEGTPTRMRATSNGDGVVRISGRIAVNAPPTVRIYPVEDPTAFARALFIEALRAEGVTVKAELRRRPMANLPDWDAVAKLPRVAQLTSPPFRETLKVTLKVSHNLYASTLPVLIAVPQGKYTLAEGMAEEGKLAAALGVDVKTISLESGAGGGNADRVSPRATVQLLQGMRKAPEYKVFRDCLPVLGVDGTLADVVARDSPVRGKVLAKTGTYTDPDLLNERVHLRSKALAGYMNTASGKELIFCFFVNDVSLPKGVDSSREGRAMGTLCEIVYKFGP